MIIRNAIAANILESVTKLGLMEIHTLNDSGEFVLLTDERVLYEELLTHLVNEIQSKGYRVTDGSFDGEPLDNLFVEKAPCDQLGNGCTCEECTNQIGDVAGWDSVDTTVYDGTPVSPDHEFEDDCERIDATQRQQDVAARSMILRREIG